MGKIRNSIDRICNGMFIAYITVVGAYMGITLGISIIVQHYKARRTA